MNKTASRRLPASAPAVSRTIRRAFSAKLSGFTLVELIVVITILAILATIGFLALSGYSSDARDAAAKANVRSVVSAISAEAALTGNSPRYYVSHDPDYALSGAYLYLGGNPAALTGGNVGEAPSDSNYTAGIPRWDRLKLDPAKFRVAGLSRGSRLASAFVATLPYGPFPSASAAFDRTSVSVGAVDAVSVSASGRGRASSFFQVAGILPETGAAVVAGNFPAPSSADLSASESNGKPAALGFVRNPDSSATEALTDSSPVSAGNGGSGTPETHAWCSLPWGGTLAHGASVAAYQSASVPFPASCVSETRTCSDGVLSGTYANASCSNPCPAGFVKVPGNAAFPTASQDFCLAKYEMKFADTAQSPGQCGGSPGIVCDDEVSGDGWKTWKYSIGAAYVSKAEWTPVAELAQGQAIAACASLGSGYHLVTNDEWMAAARNAESVADNWSGGSAGVGGMFRGNAGTDDALGCNDAGTDHVAAASADNAALSSSRSNCADKRQLKLTNGEIVWDLAGNVWEHVNGANTLDGSNYNTMNGNVCGADGWHSFHDNDGAAACSFNSPTYAYAKYGPATANMNASNGMGRIYSYPTGGSNRVLLRGGDGNSGDYAGVFTMNLLWAATNSGRTVGFRCALR